MGRGGDDDHGERSQRGDRVDLGERGRYVEMFGVGVGGEPCTGVGEAAGGVGTVGGDGAHRGRPCGRARIEEQEPADVVGEHRGEGDGFGAAEGVADHDVGPGLVE